MTEKRSVRFLKWLLRVVVSYAIFISAGVLLSFVPGSRLGLSEETFLNLRMFLMILGPVYLTLTVKIILTVSAALKGQEKDTAEKSRGVLYFVMALLLSASLSGSQTVSDLSTGYAGSKGLRNLAKSSRYSMKGRRFLNVFLPVGFYLLILEVLTLLVSIVSFAPLPESVSNVFLFLIALTALSLVFIPLVLSLVSGYRGDKAEYAQKRSEEKQKAAMADGMVLETDPIRRREYLRLPKILTLLVCPCVCLVSVPVLVATRDLQALLVVRMVRIPFVLLMAASVFSVIPLLLYWANCSGTSLVQRIYIVKDQLYYTGYSGSMEERVEFTFILLHLERCQVGKRTIRIRGRFVKITKDAYGTGTKGPFTKTLLIPRTFPVEQERALLGFLEKYS